MSIANCSLLSLSILCLINHSLAACRFLNLECKEDAGEKCNGKYVIELESTNEVCHEGVFFNYTSTTLPSCFHIKKVANAQNKEVEDGYYKIKINSLETITFCYEMNDTPWTLIHYEKEHAVTGCGAYLGINDLKIPYDKLFFRDMSNLIFNYDREPDFWSGDTIWQCLGIPLNYAEIKFDDTYFYFDTNECSIESYGSPKASYAINNLSQKTNSGKCMCKHSIGASKCLSAFVMPVPSTKKRITELNDRETLRGSGFFCDNNYIAYRLKLYGGITDPGSGNFVKFSDGSNVEVIEACIGCSECILSATECIKCDLPNSLCPSEYKGNTGICVIGCAGCPLDGSQITYLDSADNICHWCHSECAQCSGESNIDCLTCPISSQKICPTTPGGSIVGNCVDFCTQCTYSGGALKTYHNSPQNECLTCHATCEECLNGGNINQCSACSDYLCPNTDVGSSFSNEGSCVSNCDLCIISTKYAYQDNTNCRICDNSCLRCSTTGINKCISCNETHLCPNSIGAPNGRCKTVCNDCTYNSGLRKTVKIGNTCEACNITCNYCADIYFDSCLNCAAGFYFCEGSTSSQGICIANCQMDCERMSRHTYLDENGLCQPCHPSCTFCHSGDTEDKCTSCPASDFLCPAIVGGDQGFCRSDCDLCTIQDRYTYTNGITCKVCDISCLQCSNRGSRKCINCNETHFCPNSIASRNGVCVSDCDECTYGGDRQTVLILNTCLQCLACEISCYHCGELTSNNCLNCTNGLHFCEGIFSPQGKCISDCEDDCVREGLHTYEDSNGDCQKCHISCDLCSEGGPMNCTSCPAGTCLCPSTPNGSEGVCVTSCQLCSYAATNTYFLSNKCLVCDPTCNECLGPSSTECTSCYSPTSFCETGFSGNGTCIDRCDTQCVRNTRHTYVENEICLICHFDCNYCQPPGDLNSCNNCSSLVFDQLCQDVTLGIGHCLDVCDTCILNSRHTYADISKLQCLECHPLCDLCATSSTNCSTCRVHPKGYIEHIPAGSSHCWCIKGSFYEADVTEDCQACHPYCAECMSFSANMIEPLKCSECIANPGVITMDDECKCRLGDGYYEITPTGLLESLVCYPCFPLCLECHNIPTNCTICRSHPDNYIFHIPAPVYECDCVVGSYYNPNKTIPNCYRCHLFCTACYGGENTNCTACVNRISIFQSDDNCLCASDNGYYVEPSGDICSPCHTYCKTCHGTNDPTKCDSCYNSPPLVFDLSTCYCPIDGPFFQELIQVEVENELEKIPNCRACHPYCSRCYGPEYKNCTSCTEIIPNIGVIAAYTCHCDLGYFLNVGSECEKCHPFCGNCTGPTNYDCKECTEESIYDCNVCASNAFSVEGEPGFCIDDCLILEGVYAYEGKCSKCYTGCKHCDSSLSTDCTECYLPFSLSEGRCLIICALGYYPYYEICLKCHPNCRSCSGPSNTDCMTCETDIYWLEEMNGCFEDCPFSYYGISSLNPQICEKCPKACLSCKNVNHCISCQHGLYLNRRTNWCVPAEECPFSTSASEETRVCEDCHEVCLSCAGPGPSDCIECKITLGLIKKNIKEYKSGCVDLFCMSRYYTKVLPGGMKTCQKCHYSCKECNGDYRRNCLECENDRIPVINGTGGYCLDCSQMEIGYIPDTSSPGVCLEECGDGRNLGVYECDDANLLDGDGCSSKCIVETGWKCMGGDSDTPDICIDILPPQAIQLTLTDDYVLTIYLSETVKIIPQIIFEEFERSFIFSFYSSANSISRAECPVLEWKIKKSNRSSFNYIIIYIKPNCHIPEDINMKISFNKLYIEDLAGNLLINSNFTVKAPYQFYLSDTEKETTRFFGFAFNAGTLLIIAITVGMLVAQSMALESMWALINFLQIVLYIPLIDIFIPPAYLQFINDYLLLAQFKIFSFDAIRSGFKRTRPLNSHFKEAGILDLLIINNFGISLILWIGFFIVYLLVKILDKLIPEDKLEFIHRWKTQYEFDAPLRILLESFLELITVALIDIFNVYIIYIYIY